MVSGVYNTIYYNTENNFVMITFLANKSGLLRRCISMVFHCSLVHIDNIMVSVRES